MSKKVNTIIKTVAVCLIVFVLGIGFTLAYLQDTTGTKTNTFSSNKKVAIALREPAWDGYNFEDEESDGSTLKPNAGEGDWGVVQAKEYVPGQKINKNPQVKNVGGSIDGVSCYVALKVEYFGADKNTPMDYETFREKYLQGDGIEFNTGEWSELKTDVTTAQAFIYNNVVAVEDMTTALFNEVVLNTGLTPDETGRLPEFQIKVTAYAIQEKGMENAATRNDEMLKFMEMKKDADA